MKAFPIFESGIAEEGFQVPVLEGVLDVGDLSAPILSSAIILLFGVVVLIVDLYCEVSILKDG